MRLIGLDQQDVAHTGVANRRGFLTVQWGMEETPLIESRIAVYVTSLARRMKNPSIDRSFTLFHMNKTVDPHFKTQGKSSGDQLVVKNQ
ncbi:hypothetical protein [Rummeliibacillus sp. SL167]|uniref:hypothetical protein n=1 Tax=Rummeliibacillus sp. SL167 TaxID=2579792 RepID=UPI0011B74BA3|nr:hypothetical protein [Rummeliibacillus sp. SL167]